MKKIVFYVGKEYPRHCIHSYSIAKEWIGLGANYIETTQIVLMTSELFDMGYDIFINDGKREYNIKESTKKELRSAHNLYKLFVAGTFSREYK